MDIRPIDGNALISDIKRVACTDCNSYGGVRCRACWADDAMDMADDSLELSLNTLRDAIYEDAVAHGLWEEQYEGQFINPRVFAWKIESEVDELIEAGGGWYHKICEEEEEYQLNEKKEAFIEELADVIIMSFSVAGKLGIDIDAAIRNKMAVNKQRPWKHGKE